MKTNQTIKNGKVKFTTYAVQTVANSFSFDHDGQYQSNFQEEISANYFDNLNEAKEYFNSIDLPQEYDRDENGYIIGQDVFKKIVKYSYLAEEGETIDESELFANPESI